MFLRRNQENFLFYILERKRGNKIGKGENRENYFHSFNMQETITSDYRVDLYFCRSGIIHNISMISGIYYTPLGNLLLSHLPRFILRMSIFTVLAFGRFVGCSDQHSRIKCTWNTIAFICNLLSLMDRSTQIGHIFLL